MTTQEFYYYETGRYDWPKWLPLPPKGDRGCMDTTSDMFGKYEDGTLMWSEWRVKHLGEFERDKVLRHIFRKNFKHYGVRPGWIQDLYDEYWDDTKPGGHERTPYAIHGLWEELCFLLYRPKRDKTDQMMARLPKVKEEYERMMAKRMERTKWLKKIFIDKKLCQPARCTGVGFMDPRMIEQWHQHWRCIYEYAWTCIRSYVDTRTDGKREMDYWNPEWYPEMVDWFSTHNDSYWSFPEGAYACADMPYHDMVMFTGQAGFTNADSGHTNEANDVQSDISREPDFSDFEMHDEPFWDSKVRAEDVETDIAMTDPWNTDSEEDREWKAERRARKKRKKNEDELPSDFELDGRMDDNSVKLLHPLCQFANWGSWRQAYKEYQCCRCGSSIQPFKCTLSNAQNFMSHECHVCRTTRVVWPHLGPMAPRNTPLPAPYPPPSRPYNTNADPLRIMWDMDGCIEGTNRWCYHMMAGLGFFEDGEEKEEVVRQSFLQEGRMKKSDWFKDKFRYAYPDYMPRWYGDTYGCIDNRLADRDRQRAAMAAEQGSEQEEEDEQEGGAEEGQEQAEHGQELGSGNGSGRGVEEEESSSSSSSSSGSSSSGSSSSSSEPPEGDSGEGAAQPMPEEVQIWPTMSESLLTSLEEGFDPQKGWMHYLLQEGQQPPPQQPPVIKQEPMEEGEQPQPHPQPPAGPSLLPLPPQPLQQPAQPPQQPSEPSQPPAGPWPPQQPPPPPQQPPQSAAPAAPAAAATPAPAPEVPEVPEMPVVKQEEGSEEVSLEGLPILTDEMLDAAVREATKEDSSVEDQRQMAAPEPAEAAGEVETAEQQQEGEGAGEGEQKEELDELDHQQRGQEEDIQRHCMSPSVAKYVFKDGPPDQLALITKHGYGGDLFVPCQEHSSPDDISDYEFIPPNPPTAKRGVKRPTQYCAGLVAIDGQKYENKVGKPRWHRDEWRGPWAVHGDKAEVQRRYVDNQNFRRKMERTASVVKGDARERGFDPSPYADDLVPLPPPPSDRKLPKDRQIITGYPGTAYTTEDLLQFKQNTRVTVRQSLSEKEDKALTERDLYSGVQTCKGYDDCNGYAGSWLPWQMAWNSGYQWRWDQGEKDTAERKKNETPAHLKSMTKFQRRKKANPESVKHHPLWGKVVGVPFDDPLDDLPHPDLDPARQPPEDDDKPKFIPPRPRTAYHVVTNPGPIYATVDGQHPDVHKWRGERFKGPTYSPDYPPKISKAEYAVRRNEYFRTGAFTAMAQRKVLRELDGHMADTEEVGGGRPVRRQRRTQRASYPRFYKEEGERKKKGTGGGRQHVKAQTDFLVNDEKDRGRAQMRDAPPEVDEYWGQQSVTCAPHVIEEEWMYMPEYWRRWREWGHPACPVTLCRGLSYPILSHPFIIDDKYEQYRYICEECPRCGHPRMRFATKQCRGMDEGMTVLYECPLCEYRFVQND
ncbi:unnamed protein product [Vitrella brassicaformis CCMP3155]|uniref:TFIIS-type domain-containing protein n=2 Tax=Vitrella brassicaformis TaxID=1169539 RepID=A0A0G4FJQ8_VITBC|nr:unnamed protein product [Vitrella brassicaformis CCMP3155]|eukprot:CEM13929.1 unnamed protein product [Vitrella brassicaformis CCMP3155]